MEENDALFFLVLDFAAEEGRVSLVLDITRRERLVGVFLTGDAFCNDDGELLSGEERDLFDTGEEDFIVTEEAEDDFRLLVLGDVIDDSETLLLTGLGAFAKEGEIFFLGEVGDLFGPGEGMSLTGDAFFRLFLGDVSSSSFGEGASISNFGVVLLEALRATGLLSGLGEMAATGTFRGDPEAPFSGDFLVTGEDLLTTDEDEDFLLLLTGDISSSEESLRLRVVIEGLGESGLCDDVLLVTGLFGEDPFNEEVGSGEEGDDFSVTVDEEDFLLLPDVGGVLGDSARFEVLVGAGLEGGGRVIGGVLYIDSRRLFPATLVIDAAASSIESSSSKSANFSA